MKFFEHILQSIEFLCSIDVPKVDDFLDRLVYLPPKRHPTIKTLILDLDETLIHCDEHLNLYHDMSFPIKFTGGEVINCALNIRPGAKEFLQRMSNHFEIVIFTASHSCYANSILNVLDPGHKYITARIYRDSCFEVSGSVCIKDLRIFANREPKDVIIVDNAFYSFGFQPENGIPIIPYYREYDTDSELKLLEDFLLKIIDAEDVRVHISNYFRHDLFAKGFKTPDILKHEYLKFIGSKEKSTQA